MGKQLKQWQALFSWAPKSFRTVTAAMKLKDTFSLEQKLDNIFKQQTTNLDSIFKSRDITLPTKVRVVKAMVFPVVVYRCESWTLKKNRCFWTVLLEKALESLLDCKEIHPVHAKGNQSWIFIGRTDAEAEALVLWLPYAKNWPIVKDPDAGKDWRQENRMTEDEMVGWHRLLNGHEFEQPPEDNEGQGSLMCCSPWGCKTLDWLRDWATTAFFLVQLSQPYMTTGKIVALTYGSLSSKWCLSFLICCLGWS